MTDVYLNPATPLDPPLDAVETRVLGALLEKERTTPDNYPLSLNALAAACNQTSNREPVMSLDEITVSAAVDRLRRRALAKPIVHSGGRVTKYAHRAGEALGLVNRQLALLGVLALRGPQTVAELRTRAQRLHDFEDLSDVESTLDGLIDHTPPLVARLPRRPGQKEVRYAHLLAGEAVDTTPDDAAPADAPARGDRVAALEETVAGLREEVAALRAELAEFRRQFE
jgi:uncharacterized protein